MGLSEAPRLSRAGASDYPDIAALIRRELGSDNSSEDISWWYDSNPVGGRSIWLARGEAGVVGMATINDVIRPFAGRVRRFGMPQKVLVDRSMRGQGLFGRLYRETERESWERGVQGFLTFTNAASTPIFLGKFGYARGRCPDTLVFPWSPVAFFASEPSLVARSLPDPSPGGGIDTGARGTGKDWGYFHWRYTTRRPERFEFLRVPDSGPDDAAAWVVLRWGRKAGLPIVLVMDIASGVEDVRAALRASHTYACRSGAAALLALDDGTGRLESSGRASLRVRRRFNFLVKGRDAVVTGELARERFSFTFGDLDFT